MGREARKNRIIPDSRQMPDQFAGSNRYRDIAIAFDDFLKGLLPGHHLIKDYAKRINVRRGGSLTVLLHFRSHITGGAAEQIGVSSLVSGQSKISNDHSELFVFFCREDYIRGL